MSEEEGGVSAEDLSQGVLFLVVLMFGGGTIFLTNMHRIPLPFTVVMFLYGILVGAAANLVYPDVCKVLGGFPPDLLFFIFLPVLIFEGSYGMNIYAFRTVAWQVVIMATVGIVINTALLAVPIAWLMPHWSWYSAFLQGSLLSATDPVAVVSLLKGLGVDKRITAMVDGEALMNDGTAIIAFNLLLPAARLGSFGSSFWAILLKSLQLSGLPLIVGPFFGFVQLFWLGRAPNGLCQACITVSVTYISYYVADHLLGTSGVLTLLFEGLFLSAYCPTLFPGREGNLIHEIWEFLVHLGNTVLFSLVGVILVADVWPTLGGRDVLIILCLYIAMILARLAMLEVLLPVLNRFSFKITQREVLLLVHAGLRGGVSATLALAVLQDGLSIGTEVVKYTCGAVLLTLLVNATTAGAVVEALGHKKKEKNRLVEMNFGMEHLRDVGKRETQRIRSNADYQQAQWVKVENYISANFESPYKSMACEEEPEDIVANKLLMRVLKARMWALRDRVVISETVTITLANALSHCISRGELITVERIFGDACADDSQEYLTTPRAGGATLESGANGNDVEMHTAVTVASNDGDEFAVSTTPVHPLESIMLPLWVKLSERVIRPNFWEEQHKRAQQNAFVVLLAYIKCLEEVEEIKFQYIVSEEHARVIEEWITSEHVKVKGLIRKCQKMYPTAVADVASIDLTEAVLDSMAAGVHDLNSHHGFGRHTMHYLEEMLFQIRKNIPRYWGRAPRAEKLYRDALTASHLSRGLSREEILSILSLALRRQYKEGDVIDASDAFHVVVFGLVEPQRHRLSAPEEAEMVGFGSVIAIDSMVTPRSALKRWPKRWIVRSSECKTLLMPFSTVQPFLLERSLRAVHSFWRTVAAEALIDDLKDIVTLPPNAQGRRQMEEIILQGQPVIGHVECAKYDWSRNSSLCFYLRGNDSSGLFRTNITPPTYISAFFANTLKWEDPSVVLYAVPVRISEDGYTPWRFTTEGKTDSNDESSPKDRSSAAPYEGSSENDSITLPPPLPRQLPSISSLTGLDESVCAYSNAAELLCAVMTGKVRQVREDPLGGSGGTKSEDASNTSTPQRTSHADGPSPSSPWTATSFGTGTGKAALQRYPSLGYIEEADYPRLRPVTSDWSDWTFVLQHPEDFVTCVPYVNTIMLRYANVLEQLCLAAMRFWRFPKDRINRRHAVHVADVALGFMMSLCSDLFLIRRVIRCIQLYGCSRPPATPLSKALPPTRRGAAPAQKAPPSQQQQQQQREATRIGAGEEDELPAGAAPGTAPAADGPTTPASPASPLMENTRELESILAYEKESGEEASFACCVAHIARTAGESRCFELKVMIMAMRDLAEKRLRRLRTSLERAKKTHPEICKVESADELEKISKACFQ